MSFLRGVFGGGRRADTPRDVYSGLRSQALALTAPQAGGDPTTDAVFGVLVDFGVGRSDCATMVALADGTASLYTSTGGGILGAGGHAPAATAARQLVAQSESDRALFARPWTDGDLGDGDVRIICLVPSGSLAAGGKGDDLIEESHPLFAVFVAVNDLLHQIHVTDSAAGQA